MKAFHIYLDLDVSTTTVTAEFVLRAPDRDAAQAVVTAMVKDDPDRSKLVYPAGVVGRPGRGKPLRFTTTVNDPSDPYRISVNEVE